MSNLKIFFIIIVLFGSASSCSESRQLGAFRTGYFLEASRESADSAILYLDEYVQCLTSNRDNSFCSSDNVQRNENDIKFLLSLEISLLKNYKQIFKISMIKKDVELTESRKAMEVDMLNLLIKTHIFTDVYFEQCGKKGEKNLFKDAGIELYLKIHDKNKSLSELKNATTEAYNVFRAKEFEFLNDKKEPNDCHQNMLSGIFILTNTNKFLLEKIDTDKDAALIQYVSAYLASITIMQESSIESLMVTD